MFDSAVRFALIIIAAGLICFMTAELALALIRLDWRDNSNNEDGFTLERRLGTSGSYTALANVSANIVTYTDTATSSGKTYCYRIYAFNKVGKSGYSNAHCATAKSSATTLSLAAGNESSQTANAALVNPASSGDKARTGGAMDPITARYDKIGIYRPSTGEWLLDRSGNRTWDGCSIDACPELLRLAGAVPIAGDWGRSGVSKIGVFVAATDEMYLDKNGNGEWDGCKVDSCSAGVGGGKNFVVVGNWTGAKDQVGFFSADNRRWNLEGAAACGTACFEWSIYRTGDIPIVADWNGDGKTELGLYRPSSGEWFLDTDGDHVWRTCEHDMCVESFGSPGDMPVAGDWNGTGSAKIGVFRAETGEWFLDLNRNFKWDGPSVDLHVRGYGQARDLPVAGYW